MSIPYIVISLSDLLSSELYSEDFLSDVFRNFTCNRERDLEHFLQKKAIVREKRNVSRTYLFLNEQAFFSGSIDVIGLISLAVKPLDIRHFSSKKRQKLLGDSVETKDTLDTIPAFLIGQLGRSDEYSTTDLPGEYLLHEAFLIFKSIQQRVAIADLIILECRPHMYDNFYKKHGFKRLPLDDTNGLHTLGLRLSKKQFDQTSHLHHIAHLPSLE